MPTSAKRAANLAAQRQAPPSVLTDASGARIRTVGVHLTPFAPGVKTLPLDHPKRWRVFYGVTPSKIVRTTLKRLGLPARLARPGREVNGDVELLAPVPPEELRLLSGLDGELAPFAVFWDGLTLSELTETLDALSAAGWEPPPPIEGVTYAP